MDIFAFAMEKEKFAENYYREAAKKMKNEGLKRICVLLAEEEVQHYKWIEKMKSQQPDVVESEVITKSREIFAEMKESKDTFGICDSQIEIFEKAQEFEQNSKKFYEEKEKLVTVAKQKGIFKQLAVQEMKHFVLLENVIEFLKEPEYWLENAEFFHKDEF